MAFNGGRVDIWGKGGLFEKRLADVMGKEESKLGIDQQRADTEQGFREGILDVNEFEANTERLSVGEPDDGSGGGLLQVGKGRSRALFDNDGGLMGLRGSNVMGGGGGRTARMGSRRATSMKGMDEGTGSVMKDPSAYMNKGGQVPMWNEGLRKPMPQRPQQQQPAATWVTGPTRGGQTTHRRVNPMPRVVNNQESGMRKMVQPNQKLKQPGFAKSGKVKMPGPIGDVEKDTGEDKVEAVVREGEYLLNPETVAHMGGGDYEMGVRNLNQTVRDATGQEPGAEYKDGKAYANKGGLVDDYGNFIDDLTNNTAKHITQAQQSIDDFGVLRPTPNASGVAGNNRAVQAEATAARSAARPVFEPRLTDLTPEAHQAWLDDAQQTKRMRAEEIVKQRGYGQGTTQTGDALHTPRAKLPLEGSTAPMKPLDAPKFDAARPNGPVAQPPAAAAVAEGAPKAQRPTFFGRADDWKTFGKEAQQVEKNMQNYALRNWKDTGKLTKAMAPVRSAMGAALPLAGVGLSSYQLASGLREDDYAPRGDVAKGGGDLAASAALFTPAAPAAAAYFAGRAGEEVGGMVYDRMDPETQDNIGGFVNSLVHKFSNGMLGISEQEAMDAKVNAILATGAVQSTEEAVQLAAEDTVMSEVMSPEQQEQQRIEANQGYQAPDWMNQQYNEFDNSQQQGPLSEQNEIANYLARNSEVAGPGVNAGNLREMPGAPGTQYAGRYGDQEVIATTGAAGEPSFTGLRAPQQVAEERMRAEQAAVPQTYEEKTAQRIADIQSGRSSGGRDELRTLQNNLAQLEYAKVNAGGRRGTTPATAGEKVKDFQEASAPVFTYKDAEGKDQIDKQTQAEFITTVLPQMAEQLGINMDDIPAERIQALGRRWLQQRDMGQLYTRSTGSKMGFGPEGMDLGSGGLKEAREAGMGDVSMFGLRSWNGRDSGFGIGDYLQDFVGPDTMVYDYDDTETGQKGTVPVEELAPTRDLRRLTDQYGR